MHGDTLTVAPNDSLAIFRPYTGCQPSEALAVFDRRSGGFPGAAVLTFESKKKRRPGFYCALPCRRRTAGQPACSPGLCCRATLRTHADAPPGEGLDDWFPSVAGGVEGILVANFKVAQRGGPGHVVAPVADRVQGDVPAGDSERLAAVGLKREIEPHRLDALMAIPLPHALRVAEIEDALSRAGAEERTILRQGP